MTPYFEQDGVTLYAGDCLDVLATLPDCSVDAVCTDPPYGLEFMGREWDSFKPSGAHAEARTRRGDEMGDENKRRYIASGVNAYVAGTPFQHWCEQWAAECLRVLKPGGHLLAFGGTRTYHRLTCGIEDAGFEIRDEIAWLYGSGFPKSLDVSKAIDKAAGAEREVVGLNPRASQQTPKRDVTSLGAFAGTSPDVTAPATDAARTWQGWGTALKPAHEPIVVARKPLTGTVAANVLAHGTGALNIDGCRVASDAPIQTGAGLSGGVYQLGSDPYVVGTGREYREGGRWPSNVLLDGHAAAELDRQSGTLTSGANPTRRGSDKFRDAYGEFAGQEECTPARGADSGGASRFFPTFRYEAKAPTVERPLYWTHSCECEDAWPTASTSHRRATGETTAPDDSSTSKSGNDTTDAQSPKATTSTTSTGTNSTTTPRISSSSPASSTSEFTADANSAAASGGSPAESAASSSSSALPTGISAARGGRSTGGAARATLPAWSTTSVCGNCGAPARREAHATVKPLDLMRWLVRLVTPPGGTVIEPFAGSGTTAEACVIEGFRCIAIEREPDYLPLIVARLSKPIQPDLFGGAA